MSKPKLEVTRNCALIPIVPAVQQDEDYGQPGQGCKLYNELLYFACPGCGRYGSIRCGNPKSLQQPSWQIDAGSLDNLMALTLSPSIHCVGCCGWHGYLRNGKFESC